MAKGSLFLVSVGIGDPDNITVRARDRVLSADLVFSMGFLRERFADLLQGKTVYDTGHGYFTDYEINDAPAGREDEYRRIIRSAVAAGKTVAVLDFGDPGLFSPQMGYLREFADLQPTVIPGISSFNAANAAPACAIPGGEGHAAILTEAVDGRDGMAERLDRLAATRSTLVFFTMKMDLPALVARLGRSYPGDTPVAIVSNAGFAQRQSVLRATLETLLSAIEGKELAWEHMLYVGPSLGG